VTEKRSYNTYYLNYEAANYFGKPDRASLFRRLGRPYAASYDEYYVAFVSLQSQLYELINCHKLHLRYYWSKI
jgi:hypothetical protein